MEAKIRAMYMNAQKLVEYRHILTDIGHPQTPTLIRTDNKTACGILTGTMRQKASKCIDMNFHWLGSNDDTLFNGPIYVLAKIIKHVVGSAMEAEI